MIFALIAGFIIGVSATIVGIVCLDDYLEKKHKNGG